MYKRYLGKLSIEDARDHYDVIVVGAGVSGIYAALSLLPDMKVLLISKGSLRDCNSNLAQGGIAMTLDGDYHSHVVDTLKAGSYYNDPKVVEEMIRMSRPVYEDLIQFGTKFDQNDDGTVSMTAEGGHTKRRIVHCKDLTGEGVMTALISTLEQRSNIQVLENAMAVDLFTNDCGEISGLSLIHINTETEAAYTCSNVVIATGGIGGLFKATTNAKTVSGDGIAMAIRAGASVKDMEFIQYHPTAMALTSGGYFLISEAVRGEGGLLINDLGQRFMDGKHEMRELAPRDVVAKAIYDEQQKGRSVFVDVRHICDGSFQKRFPNIYKACCENGTDPALNPIPITPVEHYFMGGIEVDANGRTAVVGLYATGEAARSGFHGANRLASNSLLECLTLSKRLSEVINLAGASSSVGGPDGGLEKCSNLEALSEAGQSGDVQGLSSYKAPLANEFTEEEFKLIGAQFKERFSQVFAIIKNKASTEAALCEFDGWLEACHGLMGGSVEMISLYNGLMIGREIGLGVLSREASLGGFIIEEDNAHV